MNGTPVRVTRILVAPPCWRGSQNVELPDAPVPNVGYLNPMAESCNTLLKFSLGVLS